MTQDTIVIMDFIMESQVLRLYQDFIWMLKDPGGSDDGDDGVILKSMNNGDGGILEPEDNHELSQNTQNPISESVEDWSKTIWECTKTQSYK